MGSDIRLIIETPLQSGLPPPAYAAARERHYIEAFAQRLSRFRADSELSSLNAALRTEVDASLLLRTAVAAGVWAAERSGGIVDPTLLGQIESLGYRSSHEGREPASLELALAAAPPRRTARADCRSRWREIEIDNERGTVRRPVGLGIDTGGTGKGLAADAVAHRLRGYTRFVVDCGGDIVVGGVGAQLDPLLMEVEHPLTGECARTLRIAAGGVATSGLNVNIWRCSDGSFAHHLLDPATGEPAWSGLIGATALAPSALEAETLAKLALLTGPAGARRALAEHGGLVVHEDGEVEPIGPIDGRAKPAELALRRAA